VNQAKPKAVKPMPKPAVSQGHDFKNKT